MNLIKKYTTKSRVFKFSPDRKFITVYMNGRANGFIWNNDREIMVDGDRVIAREFFK